MVDGHRNKLGVNGVGNMFGDYVLWFAAAAASRRALFIDWTTGVEGRRGHGKHRRFDLGVHFSGKGAADWAWSDENVRRVRSRLQQNHTLSLSSRSEVRCGAIWQLINSDTPWVTLQLGENSAIALVPKCSGPANGRGGYRRHRRLAERFFAWQRARRAPAGVASEEGAELEQLETMAREAERGVLDSPLGLGGMVATSLAAKLTRDGIAAAPNRSAALTALRSLRPWLHLDRHPAALFSEAARDSTRRTALGDTLACILHSMMRPRPRLQETLRPYLERLSGAAAVVALQVRTGWADALQLVPAALEGRDARSARLVEQLLERAPGGEFEAAASCRELPPAEEAARRACGPACSCKPSRTAAFGAGLREFIAPFALRTNRSAGPYSGADAADVLLNASARWQMLVDAEPIVPDMRSGRDWQQADRALRECGTVGGREGPPLPGGTAWARHSSPTALASRLAQSAECAVRAAHALAAARGEPDAWMLAVSSDAPGLVAMLQHLPALRGRVVGCIGHHCHEHPSASEQHSQRSAPDSNHSLQVAVDLYLQGAADHLLPATTTTMSSWSTRAGPTFGRGHVLGHTLSAGEKHLPICQTALAPSPLGADRPPGGACMAAHWAVLSSVAARALTPGSRTPVWLHAALLNFTQRALARDGSRDARSCTHVDGYSRKTLTYQVTGFCKSLADDFVGGRSSALAGHPCERICK